jgi:hypothetical protein
MPNTVSFRGGAQIGWINATWPFGSLEASASELTFRVFPYGTYTFHPNDVVRMDRYTVIPVLGWGVRIHHVRADYPARMIFWCLGSPERVLKRIAETGFHAQAKSAEPPARRTMPVRWISLVLGILIWNACCLIDFLRHRRPGLGAVLGLSFVLFVSTGLWWLRPLQWAVMKPGRSPREIRQWLMLLALVSALLLTLFSITHFMGTPLKSE